MIQRVPQMGFTLDSIFGRNPNQPSAAANVSNLTPFCEPVNPRTSGLSFFLVLLLTWQLHTTQQSSVLGRVARGVGDIDIQL